MRNMVQKMAMWGGMLCMVSCSSFLDEIPDDRTLIDSHEKIRELLTDAYPKASYFLLSESMSDNASDKGSGTAVSRSTNAAMYNWEDIEGTTLDMPSFYWNECYKAIAQANHALKAIDELTLEGYQDELLDPLRGEALLARAYAHFMLVNLWAMSYDPATSSTFLGVPVVIVPETKVYEKYKRNTVQEVYDQIEKDIVNGIPLINDDYVHPKFHFTVNAAKAFASRFYLFKGNWSKVIQYASEVLGENPGSNLRGWNEGIYASNYLYLETKFRYQSSDEPANLLLVSAKSAYARDCPTMRYGLSLEKWSSLFNNGTNPVGNWAYKIYGNILNLNIPKFEEYFEITNPESGTGEVYTTCVLLSYDEVLLNRSEAYTMAGNFDAAISDINLFFSKKTSDYNSDNALDYNGISDFYMAKEGELTPFYEITEKQLPFIKCIAELRRREFYHEGMRWFDNKRFNMEVIHEDNQGNNSVLSKEDNRKALQIPEIAQSLGLKPNPR